MNTCIQEIHREFDRVGIKHHVEEKSGNWLLITSMTGKSHTYQFIFVKSGNAGNDASLRTAPIVHIPAGKNDAVYTLLNEFHQKYRFIKFYLDNDGDVMSQYDFALASDSIGKSAAEVLIRFTKILDDCYPRLMQQIWR